MGPFGQLPISFLRNLDMGLDFESQDMDLKTYLDWQFWKSNFLDFEALFLFGQEPISIELRSIWADSFHIRLTTTSSPGSS